MKTWKRMRRSLDERLSAASSPDKLLPFAVLSHRVQYDGGRTDRDHETGQFPRRAQSY
jgi:hypothetical protein